MTHNSISGVAHFIASNDEDCIAQIRRLLSFLPSNNMEMVPVYETTDDINRIVPEFDELVPENPNKAYDVLDIIRAVADDGDYYEVQEHYAKNIVTCFIRLNGQTVGAIANQPKVLAGCLILMLLIRQLDLSEDVMHLIFRF